MARRRRRVRGLRQRGQRQLQACRFKFLCGGGDVEHSFSFGLGKTPANGHGSFDFLDPYCDLYQGVITDRVFALAAEGRRRHRTDTGFGAPVVYHAMGDGNLACAPGGDLDTYAPVRTSHSNCVLAQDIETPRSLVQDFYARAAETPQEALCCPVSYDGSPTRARSCSSSRGSKRRRRTPSPAGQGAADGAALRENGAEGGDAVRRTVPVTPS